MTTDGLTARANPVPATGDDGYLALPCGSLIRTVEEWNEDHRDACATCLGNFGPADPVPAHDEPYTPEVTMIRNFYTQRGDGSDYEDRCAFFDAAMSSLLATARADGAGEAPERALEISQQFANDTDSKWADGSRMEIDGRLGAMYGAQAVAFDLARAVVPLTESGE